MSIIIIIVMIIAYIHYDPNIDFIPSGSNYDVILWYNKNKKREFVKLFTIRK